MSVWHLCWWAKHASPVYVQVTSNSGKEFWHHHCPEPLQVEETTSRAKNCKGVNLFFWFSDLDQTKKFIASPCTFSQQEQNKRLQWGCYAAVHFDLICWIFTFWKVRKSQYFGCQHIAHLWHTSIWEVQFDTSLHLFLDGTRVLNLESEREAHLEIREECCEWGIKTRTGNYSTVNIQHYVWSLRCLRQ